ncbi:MAG TPA: DUF4058 family protein [Pirellulales bacterium]|nr:DUF4058 family protein [Pirellulales bacterium]
MPLRDHFRPPVSKRASWEGFHGLWPGMMVQQLAPLLPDGLVAEPRVHLGSFYEIDVSTFEQNEETEPVFGPVPEPDVGIATAPQAPPAPTLTLDAEFPEQYAYEVLVFDLERNRRLVAAIEIVSPANKDRPDSRQLFVAKCFNLLRKDVCLSIIDMVSIRQFNLYAELLALLNRRDSAFQSPPPTYAVTCRKRQVGRQTKLDTSSFPLAVGQPLPVLPIWLSETQTISLDLEASYEASCRVLRIS